MPVTSARPRRRGQVQRRRLLETVTGVPATDGNRVEVLRDGVLALVEHDQLRRLLGRDQRAGGTRGPRPADGWAHRSVSRQLLQVASHALTYPVGAPARSTESTARSSSVISIVVPSAVAIRTGIPSPDTHTARSLARDDRPTESRRVRAHRLPVHTGWTRRMPPRRHAGPRLARRRSRKARSVGLVVRAAAVP